MPEIKFSPDKAGRWLARIEKRLDRLSPDDVSMYSALKTHHEAGEKLTPTLAKALWELERKL